MDFEHKGPTITTKAFPENEDARNGDKVRIVMRDIDDQRPVEDILWTDEAYQDVYNQAKLEIVKVHKPLGSVTEPFSWISETTIPPWVVYALRPIV